MLVQYDDHYKMAREPIHGILLAAGYVAFPDQGDDMVEEEGAQGSRDPTWGPERATGIGDVGGGGSRSKKQKGAAEARSENVCQVHYLGLP